MDWKVAATTFGIVFLAELGDKTQFAALALSGRSGRPFSVFLGAGAALLLATLLGVAAGVLLKKALPDKALTIVSGLIFLGFGVFTLFRAFGGPR